MYSDCPEGDDEVNCAFPTRAPPPPPTPLHCTASQAYCHDHRGCYEKAAHCDGMEDCLDASDEQHCKVRPTSCKATEFQCPGTVDVVCILKTEKCNGIKDCYDGADEKDCHKVETKCYPAPFGFNCTKLNGICLLQDALCNKKQDCDDRSDEEHPSCTRTNRVRGLKHTHTGDTHILLTWDHPANVSIADAKDGYIVAKYHENTGSVWKKKIGLNMLSFNMTGLHKCHTYRFGVALNNKKVKLLDDNLFTTTQIVMESPPAQPRNVKISNTKVGDVLTWDEDDMETPCFANYRVTKRIVNCGKGDANPVIHSQKVLLDRVLDDLQHTSKCTLDFTYVYKLNKIIHRRSTEFFYPPKDGGHAKHHASTGGKGKKGKTYVWAIPVALVLTACVAGFALMVYKYRRLQLSFLNFAARSNYTRTENDFDEDDDDNMIVGFRSGEDAPMINRFSDDDPLVVG